MSSKSARQPGGISRRDFLKAVVMGSSGLLAACVPQPNETPTSPPITATPAPVGPVVSIVKIKDRDIGAAVEEAIRLLGGIETVASGKERIMLKPNLVSNDPRTTTKPEVIRSLAALMKKAGKVVSIGEGSAAVVGFNVIAGNAYRLNDPDRLNDMQRIVFDSLGYTELARALDVPLVNLHTGEMVEVEVPGGLAYQRLTIHRSLTEIDLLCSVPMMKTHGLASVTLGMKNLIGLYPGSVYRTVRAGVHDHAADAGSPGVAFEILDMVRANKLGLVVIDGSTAMEGNGPSDGVLVPMDIIIAGTNPLATDMVAANVMGFEPDEIPTFVWAHKTGMQPQHLDEIEIRGEKVSRVRRNFARPQLTSWNAIRSSWGVEEMP
ncbi:MAG TPA: DUF362 domain-containing protein [Anaerolineales bacterium]|nr:DUF362 domain-containing protein [Anaerolineales bacterium]